MEAILLILFLVAVLFLFMALFEISYIDSLKKQVKESYDSIPPNTPVNDMAPEIGYIFPDVIPLTTTTIRLGRQPQRITVYVPNCPECGSYLIEREGKYGKFWGCTGYPNCHYTKRYS